MIKVKYFYSACVGIETENLSILCDPWFTQGAFDGSWYHYPPPPKDPLAMIGPYKFIYVSHLHGDHYDPQFIKQYLRGYPATKVLIADFKEPNYLDKMMTAEGIKHQVLSSTFEIGKTKFKIFPNESHVNDVDSALAVTYESEYSWKPPHSVVNMNDNRYNQEQVYEIKDFIGERASIGLFSYALGSGHPQTFYESGSRRLEQKKHEKIQLGIDRYLQFKEAFDPYASIPFAGKYVLGGKLSKLNDGRAVIDAVDMLEYDKDAVILADHGAGTITTNAPKNPSIKIRTKPYDNELVNHYIESISREIMDYEKYFGSFPVDKMPIERLVTKAFKNAISKSRCEEDFYICLRWQYNYFVMNVNKNKQDCKFLNAPDMNPSWYIEIDPKHLFGLLTNVFHWDNASVGSHYQTRRFPDGYVERVQHFLYFLHI